VDAGAVTPVSGFYVRAVAFVQASPSMRSRLSVLLGPGGATAWSAAPVEQEADRGRRVAQAVLMTAIRQIDKVLGTNFGTMYGTK